MSGRLQGSQDVFQDYFDDRESALWVLLWVALQFTLTHGCADSSAEPNPDLLDHMMMFDLVAGRRDGTVTGGKLKIHFLDHYSPTSLMFNDRPVLARLVETLAGVFAIRYAKQPAAEQVARLDTRLARGFNDSAELKEYLDDSHVYQHRLQMDKLHKKGWLVDTIREYLTEPGWWPEADKARVQETQTVTSTKRKRAQVGYTVWERLSRRNPHAHSGGSTSILSRT